MKKHIMKVHDKYFSTYLESAVIQERIDEIGKELETEYNGKRPLFLAILNGSFMFASDMLKAVPIECEIQFVRLSSYQGTNSTGKVQMVMGLDVDLKNRHVVLLEDIIDTGNTLHHFLPILHAQQPASFKIVTLLFKPEAFVHKFKIDHIGFSIPNKFVVGYGLDYDGLGRNYPTIYQLEEEVTPTAESKTDSISN